jgi:hypothetical protein
MILVSLSVETRGGSGSIARPGEKRDMPAMPGLDSTGHARSCFDAPCRPSPDRPSPDRTNLNLPSRAGPAETGLDWPYRDTPDRALPAQPSQASRAGTCHNLPCQAVSRPAGPSLASLATTSLALPRRTTTSRNKPCLPSQWSKVVVMPAAHHCEAYQCGSRRRRPGSCRFPWARHSVRERRAGRRVRASSAPEPGPPQSWPRPP